MPGAAASRSRAVGDFRLAIAASRAQGAKLIALLASAGLARLLAESAKSAEALGSLQRPAAT